MLRSTAASVVPHDNYILRVKFDNGEGKLFDVKSYITRKKMSPTSAGGGRIS
jgi:hypothetical protein